MRTVTHIHTHTDPKLVIATFLVPKNIVSCKKKTKLRSNLPWRFCQSLQNLNQSTAKIIAKRVELHFLRLVLNALVSPVLADKHTYSHQNCLYFPSDVGFAGFSFTTYLLLWGKSHKNWPWELGLNLAYTQNCRAWNWTLAVYMEWCKFIPNWIPCTYQVQNIYIQNDFRLWISGPGF